jgi:prolipoprotein diacylglyceryl transferase
LGIWGAISVGALAAFIFFKMKKTSLSFYQLADAIAPGLLIAQGIGRFGNWFNAELFGKPTTLFWGLEIPLESRPAGYENFTTFHPTFLYEALACVAIGFFVIWADKRYVMGHGRVFGLYAALYCSARGLIETMRIDDSHHILGIRFNVFTALVIGALALLYLVRSSEKNPGRELMSGGKLVIQGQEPEILPAAVETIDKVSENSDSQPSSSPAVQIDEPRQRGRRAKPKR